MKPAAPPSPRSLIRSRSVLALAGATAITLALATPAPAAQLLPGFGETTVTDALTQPTAMALARDGRIFVCEQRGTLRVIQDGHLLAQPFLSLAVDARGERGLLGIALHPDFPRTPFVYLYYTATSPSIHNRVSRFTANGNRVRRRSERKLLDLSPLSAATNHNGGALHFGRDGNLYLGVGDNANGANAQSLGTPLGKILRIRANGVIPHDNPFWRRAHGVSRAIWALGLRNPFTFAFAASGRMLINDVGQSSWEEIDEGRAGANYGWPVTEGSTDDPRFQGPLFSYGHGDSATTGCAITGAAFYEPAVAQFPPEYAGSYFFGDLCSGWIRRLDAAGDGTVSDFASEVGGPVDFAVAADGSLYYLAIGEGALRRIRFSG